MAFTILNQQSAARHKEREWHGRKQAETMFALLLADHARTPDDEWADVKRQLKGDARYADLADVIGRERRRELFDEHVEALIARRRAQFRQLLSDVCGALPLDVEFGDVRDELRRDARCVKFSKSDRKCEREFDAFQRERIVLAKAEFMEMLAESKLLDHTTLDKVSAMHHQQQRTKKANERTHGDGKGKKKSNSSTSASSDDESDGAISHSDISSTDEDGGGRTSSQKSTPTRSPKRKKVKRRSTESRGATETQATGGDAVARSGGIDSVIAMFSRDRRFTDLAVVASGGDLRTMIVDHLRTLKRRGSPPPPTAGVDPDPTRRKHRPPV